MSNLEKIIQIIKEVSPMGDENIEADTELIESGIIDSFDTVSLIMELNDEFEIEIGVEEILPENFETPEKILALVEEFLGEN
ncbi:phosphopantetheine-binding protein [Peptoniphilus sp. GNH]|nr:putative D-alanine--poly(phosphoribitol) ligase, subunit 2 [Clostridiales bacterium KA00134]UHR02686.1 phosphopantetheine-binding protein [Peptoniphilus sp. GNH]